ncbi:SGNH/GDSL hydrolase family protein [Cohnella nanjingensis]|uniref:SGNH/GDSL hydrolase family protein n=1 Tax=Cohnella nanjingensis TaxID=1387779 RepID=A0A7X0RQQ8_9BACL|nr:SGNH/GDSL hydrolase family protein [Cohnella nanjingensis]MBB6670756.1 SGNH/GDSL hydrolase family protein [Cohnella nanjingensis]
MNGRLRKLGIFAVLLILIAGCTENHEPQNRKGQDETRSADAAIQSEGEQVDIQDTNDAMSKRSIVNAGDEARIVKAMRKARRKEKVTIGFIGGSITEGAAASAEANRYASLTFQWWKDKFPDTPIEMVNAGIGATDSYIGVHRVDRDLLQAKPDFVVIDYAVNDSDSPQLMNQYEGLVRKILQSDNKPGVLLLFMVHQDGTNLQWVHGAIGSYYDLPMISFKDAVWPQIKAGRIGWEQLFADEVHPNDAGHRLAAKFITDRLEKIYADLDKRGTADDAIVALPEPKTSEGYAHAALLTGDDIAPVSNSGWTKGKTMRFSPGWVADQAGQSIVFDIDAVHIGIVYEKSNNNQMGRAEVQVDDLPPSVLEGHYPASWGGYPAGELVASGLKKGTHKVKITFLAEHDPNSTGKQFKICALLAAY